MIKFFRKIRQSLLGENKFSKYLLYAIGEIILVVIGILIALQINNNNEAKNNKEHFIKVLKEIRQDLETDISNATAVLRIGQKTDSLVDLVLDKKLTREDYLNDSNLDLLWVGLQFNNFDYQKTAFKKFENFQGIIPAEFDSLTKSINNYYNISGKFYDDVYSILREQVQGRHDYLANNFDWYYLLRKGQAADKMVDFYLNNPIFMNWVSRHKLDNTSAPGGVVASLQGSAFSLLLEINKYLDDFYEINNENLLKKYGEPVFNEHEEWLGNYEAIESSLVMDIYNIGGYLNLSNIHFLKRVHKDTLAYTNTNRWIVVARRNSEGILDKIEFIHHKDSTQNIIAKKVYD
mgnify:CR=1 FL=1